MCCTGVWYTRTVLFGDVSGFRCLDPLCAGVVLGALVAIVPRSPRPDRQRSLLSPLRGLDVRVPQPVQKLAGYLGGIAAAGFQY
jgi:hypothetical protein